MLSPRRLAAFFLSVSAAITATSRERHADSRLIPLANRQAMVFDHASQNLYITTTTGTVQRYNLASSSIDKTFNLGGTLNGIDIAPDDSFLLVTQEEPSGTDGILHKVNLA